MGTTPTAFPTPVLPAAILAADAMAVDNTNFKGCWRPEEDEALRK
jgi:hypothetical protein